MSKELAKKYDPKNVEDRIYKTWLEHKYFHAERQEGKKTYTILRVSFTWVTRLTILFRIY